MDCNFLPQSVSAYPFSQTTNLDGSPFGLTIPN